MTLNRINGKLSSVPSETGGPEKVTITLTCIEDIDRVYDNIRDDENFILVDDKTSKLIVANPLASKLENGELDVVSSS